MPRLNRSTQFEPMKAHSQSPTKEWLEMCFKSGIHFLVTDKFDGIRACNTNQGLLSRTLKPIPNLYVREYIEKLCPTGFDGELMIRGNFSGVQSAIMSQDGAPDFSYHVFDDFSNASAPYEERVERLQRFWKMNESCSSARLVCEMPRLVKDFATLQIEEAKAIERGREGLILRVPWGPYKFGRSTLNEAWMLKLKTWEDAEATIVDFEPLQRNQNAPQLDNFGRQKRSSRIEGKVAEEMLGAWVVKHPTFGIFNVGGPYTILQRCIMWKERYNWINKIITFKYQPHGTKEKPRSPQFKAVRLD